WHEHVQRAVGDTGRRRASRERGRRGLRLREKRPANVQTERENAKSPKKTHVHSRYLPLAAIRLRLIAANDAIAKVSSDPLAGNGTARTWMLTLSSPLKSLLTSSSCTSRGSNFPGVAPGSTRTLNRSTTAEVVPVGIAKSGVVTARSCDGVRDAASYPE